MLDVRVACVVVMINEWAIIVLLSELVLVNHELFYHFVGRALTHKSPSVSDVNIYYYAHYI